jgi:hypothetical protein
MNAFLGRIRGPRPLLVGVRLTLRGRVVEDRALLCTDTIRLGEGPGAKVAFPGADILVVPWGPLLGIGTDRLPAGAFRVFDYGAVQVRVEHIERGPRLGRELLTGLAALFDLGYLLVVVAVVGLATWWDGQGQVLLAPRFEAALRCLATMVRSLVAR